jgi:sugar lactone lactonase YvrE
MAKSRAPEAIETALASFERAVKLFPGSDVAPIALLDMASALNAAGRQEDALTAYRRVTTQFPQSLWAIRAELGAARALVRVGQTPRALEALGRVRARYGSRRETAGPELTRALEWSTLLYRLHLRPSMGQVPYAPSGRTFRLATGRLEDVIAVAVDRTDTVYAAREQGVSSFKADGTFASATAAQDVQNLFVTADGGVAILRKGGITFVGQPSPVQLTAPKPDKTIRPLEDVPAGVALSTGELLIADRETRTILRFASDGKHVGRFADGDPVRMSVDAFDNVALLDRESRGITVHGHDGRAVGKVPRRGTGYEFKNPVDMVFDSLGHLYVLDRDSGTVFVFNPQWQLVTQFSLPENAPGAFRRARAFGIDSVGRLHIFDDRGGLQTYQ